MSDSLSNAPYLNISRKKRNISFPKTLTLSLPESEKEFSHG